jgi:hypothetical protein
MEALVTTMTRFVLALTTPPPRDERGDVPGWVLVTVMTAGLVMVIWGVAEDQLRSMLSAALSKVK